MLLMRSIGMMRRAPKSGLASPKAAAPAAADAALPDESDTPPDGAEPVAPEALDAVALPPLTNRKAASTSLTEAYLRGKTPTDMPLSKSTSKVLTNSIQPSAWVRVPIMTSRLRTVSTRTRASAATIGRRMAAISAAPMYCRGMMTVPYPGAMGGVLPLPLIWRTEPAMFLSASARPAWNVPRASRTSARPLACKALSSRNTA